MKTYKYLFLFLLILTSCQSHISIRESSWHSTEIIQKDDTKKLIKSELYIFPNEQQVKLINYYSKGIIETVKDKYTVDGKYIIVDTGKVPPFVVKFEIGKDFIRYKDGDLISITYRKTEDL